MQKNKRKETQAQARNRIAMALTGEIKAFQEQKMPNEMIGIKVMAALIDARLEIEQLKMQIAALSTQIGTEIKSIIQHGKTIKSC